MRDTETILIIDDDEQLIRTYHSLLGEEGYLTETAMDGQAALARLEERSFGVVLLDQKLQGPRGPDTGLDLIAEIRKRAPSTKILIVTAYAEPRAIKRAFEAGVYDYLEKNEIFAALLRAKVANAFDLVRERHLAELDVPARDAELRARWRAAQAETDRHRKGKMLEDLMAVLFRTVPGWHAETRLHNELEEIDVVIRNESADPLWSKEGQYLIAECKHWSKPVGVAELRSFLWKLHNRYGRCHLGFFVTTQRFTEPFLDELRRGSKSNVVVIAIDGPALEQLITSRDRNQDFKSLHREAVIGNGSARSSGNDDQSTGQ